MTKYLLIGVFVLSSMFLIGLCWWFLKAVNEYEVEAREHIRRGMEDFEKRIKEKKGE